MKVTHEQHERLLAKRRQRHVSCGPRLCNGTHVVVKVTSHDVNVVASDHAAFKCVGKKMGPDSIVTATTDKLKDNVEAKMREFRAKKLFKILTNFNRNSAQIGKTAKATNNESIGTEVSNETDID